MHTLEPGASQRSPVNLLDPHHRALARLQPYCITKFEFHEGLYHRGGLRSSQAVEHHLAATNRMLGCRQVYFIDNVATSGNTMRAARAALGRDAGLVFADAAGHSEDAQRGVSQ